MLTERLLTFSVLVPVTVAALIILVMRRPWRPGETHDGVVAGALAVGVGWALGLLADPTVGIPHTPAGAARLPVDSWEWLPFIGLLYMLMRLLLRNEHGKLPFGSWMVIATASIAFCWIFGREILDMDTWDRKRVAPLAVVLGLAWTGHTSTMESLCIRRGGPALAFALTLQSVALYACLALVPIPSDLGQAARAERFAEAALALAGVLGILAFYGYLRPGRAAVRGIGFPFSGIQVSLMLAGYLQFGLPWVSVLLLGVAPCVLYVPLRPQGLLASSLLRGLLILVPSIGAFGWSWYLYVDR